MDKKKKEYHRLDMKKRYDERMRLAHTLLGNKCNVCCSVDRLEIDHIDWKTKKFDISSVFSRTESRFLEELAKCQLLCKTCHIEKTKKDVCEMRTGFSDLPHGYVRYNERKCRCEICVKGIRDYTRNYRKLKNPDYKMRTPSVCGTRSMYTKGCRCLDCKAANSKYFKDLKLRRL